MNATERMPIAEWADGHEITEAEAIRWLVRAGIKPSPKGLTPAQWNKLDNYVYDTTGKSCCASLRA
jgi:hypothetical protein